MLTGAAKTALQQAPSITGSSRCRKAAADQILESNYCHLEVPRPKQDVVPIDMVPEQVPEQPVASQMPQRNSHLDNSHTIEVVIKDIIIRINNGAAPLLLSRTFQLIQESIC